MSGQRACERKRSGSPHQAREIVHLFMCQHHKNENRATPIKSEIENGMKTGGVAAVSYIKARLCLLCCAKACEKCMLAGQIVIFNVSILVIMSCIEKRPYIYQQVLRIAAREPMACVNAIEADRARSSELFNDKRR